MPKTMTGFALAALVFALLAGATGPASATFYGCDDQHPGRTSSARAPSFTHASPFTDELAAQTRPRVTIHPRRSYPGRNAKRQCRSWLVKEYRVSGPVIVPHQRCWWE